MSTSDKPEVPNRINSLREDLYSRDEEGHTHGTNRGQKFHHDEYALKEDWETEHLTPAATVASMSRAHTRKSPVKLLLLASVGFFFFAAAVAIYVFYAGINLVSTDNVNISAIVPVQVPGGEVTVFKVNIENDNDVDLEGAVLTVTFPEGTKKSTDIGADLRRYTETVGVVPKGGVAMREIEAVFFGEENTQKEILISIEYRIKGSNALLYKEKVYDFLLTAAPVSMSVQGLKEIQSGQEVEFNVTLVSNSKTSVNDLLLKAEYPFGFEFKSASPKSTFANNIWKIDRIDPAEKRVFKIRGTIVGQNEEERVFRFSIGIRDKQNEKLIGTTFLSVQHGIIVERPFIGVDIAMDGEIAEEHVVRPGTKVRADVLWSNNLPNRIIDSVIEVKLNGNLFIPRDVSADQGFYRSQDNLIIWDQTGNPTLTVLEPGTKGAVGFGMGMVPTASIVGMGIKNPEMSFSVSVKGKRLAENAVPEEIDAFITKKVKFATEVNFSSRSSYALGAIPNRGPIPPRVGQETTYTVIWTLMNTSNTVTGGQVKAILPSYMKWMGVVNPSTENVSFQPVGGTVTWDVGAIKPYTGFSGTPREVAFQVSIVPSLSQLDTAPVILREATFLGTDEFTGTQFRIVRPDISTETRSDPGYSESTSNVTQ